MNQLTKLFQKNPCYVIAISLFVCLSLYLSKQLFNWSEDLSDKTEFVGPEGRIVQYGAGTDSVTDDVSLRLSPEGGQNISNIVGIEERYKSNWCAFGCNRMTVAPDSRTTTCVPRADLSQWNRDVVNISQGAGTQNTVTLAADPFNPNQSELVNQFFRDVQNGLSNHSVENFRYPASSSLTSSYRTSPNYCGVGQLVTDQIVNDRCFDTTEYQTLYNRDIRSRAQRLPQFGPHDASAPDVINNQSQNYNRRLSSQISYNPVKVYEVLPANGLLNEKSAHFTSEHTRTFDNFTTAGLGHAELLY
jgi:hypothetical protein